MGAEAGGGRPCEDGTGWLVRSGCAETGRADTDCAEPGGVDTGGDGMLVGGGRNDDAMAIAEAMSSSMRRAPDGPSGCMLGLVGG